MSAGEAAVGFDVGGQSVKAALVDHGGAILTTARAPTGREIDGDALAERIAGLLDTLSQTAPSSGPVGVGVPGVLSKDGALRGSPNLPLLLGLPIERLVSRRLGVAAIVDNDANCFAVAEGWGGAAEGRSDFFAIAIGSGLGSGLVLGGRVFHGSTGYGCEFGHAVVVQGGRRCGCGNRGCLEAYVSETGIRDWIGDIGGGLAEAVARSVRLGEGGHAQALFELADRGDEDAVSLAGQVVDVLGTGLGSAVNMLDLTTIVLGGGIAPPVLARRERLLASIDRSLFARSVETVEILAASRGPFSGAIGAARLAMLAR